ncbi:MAG: hypothetical protein IKU10_01950, partial [Clostridia bacterium]|nr:hypothetical protein [Clostridia bacterium]
MKKSLCFSIIFCLLISACSFTTFVSSAEPPLPLRVSFCDSPLVFVNGAYPSMNIVADGETYTEAPASLHISGTGSSMILYTSFAPLD